MDQFDILFALKDLFKDTCGKQVISQLNAYPIIWDYLGKPENFHNTVNHLGTDCELWTSLNLCKVAAGLKVNLALSNVSGHIDSNQIDSLSTNSDFPNISTEIGLDKIFTTAQRIAKYKSKATWQDIFNKLGLQSYLFDDSQKILETMLSIVSELTDNKSEIIYELLNYPVNDNGPKLLAHLLMMNKYINKNLLDSSSVIFPKTLVNNFTNFIKELQFLGDQDFRPKLVKKFIEIVPLDEAILLSNNIQSFPDELAKLLYIKNYAYLYEIINCSKDSERLIESAKKVLASVGKKFDFNIHNVFWENTDKKNINYEPSQNIIDQKAESDINELVREIDRLKRIAKSDSKSAKTIAIDVFNKYLKNCDLTNLIFHKDFGFLIKPEDLVRVYIDLELIIQAHSLSDLLLKSWPQNSQLLRTTANLSHDNGDHTVAINQFLQLEIIDNLSREEKQKLASSLEYAGRWKDALIVRKGINITSENDIYDEIFCAYYAQNLEVINNLLSDHRFEIKSSTVFSLLPEIINKEIDHISNNKEKIALINFSAEKNIKSILLVDGFLCDAGEYEKSIKILKNYSKTSCFSLSIINRLHYLYQRIGDLVKSREVLDFDLDNDTSDQKSFEAYIENSIRVGNIDKADQLLEKYSKKWVLSPRKIGLTAKILIEKGKFQQASNILRSIIDSGCNELDILFDSCLAMLDCKLSDFPFGINTKKFNRIIDITNLIDFSSPDASIFIELLAAELASDEQLEIYQHLLIKYSDGQNPEAWRVFAGLGKVYFNKKQFDAAIINIKHACSILPDNENLIWLLIQSYANLRLWNEIENIFNSSAILNKKSLIRILENLEIPSDLLEWSRFLENQVQKRPNEIVYKILLSQSLAANGKKAEAIELIRNFYEDLNLDDPYYLLCSQILIKANEPLLAERLIEIYLSNKKSLNQGDYLSSAFLYEQLGKLEKSLTMINQLEVKDPVLLTYKAKLLFESGNFNKSLYIITLAIENINVEEVNLRDILVFIPDSVKSIQNNPALAYMIASSLELNNKAISKAISFLEKGLDKYPENQEILFYLFELLNITGKNDEINQIISEHNITPDNINLPSLACLMGEIALFKKEEITCARYLSVSMKMTPENPRVKALQARMIAVNGNFLDAEQIFGSVIKEKLENEDDKKSIFQNGNLIETYSKLWLAQAALDLKDYQRVLKICQQEIARIGINPHNTHLFLSALASVLERKFILDNLNVRCHNNLLEDSFIDTFTSILKNHTDAHSYEPCISDLLIRCQIYLENDTNNFAKAEHLSAEKNNFNTIIYGIYKTKGVEAAEIAFNGFESNFDNEFFLAVLEKDNNPQKALAHLKRITAMSNADACEHALLSFIEKNNGNISNAYAAINLALVQWPDEYEWQVMAGDLSKASGDLHASMAHYENAQRLNNKSGVDKEINALKLSLESERAIPILEEQLAKYPNKEQFIQLGKIYLKFGNYRKAINAFETAAKNYPQDAMPYFWLSEMASRLNNHDKALSNIEKALKKDSSNTQLICKKINVLSKVYGHIQALNFLDEVLSDNSIDDKLLLLKSKLLSEKDGDNTALRFINSLESLQEKPRLLLEKAKIEFKLGELDASEAVAEKLLNQKDLRSEVLALLGLIAKARGELDRAIDFFIKAIEFDPFSAEQFIQLAEIYHNKKDFKRALETLEDGIKTNPGSFSLLYKAGLYCYQHGLYSESENRIKEAIKIEPDHQAAKEVLRLLKNVKIIKTVPLISKLA